MTQFSIFAKKYDFNISGTRHDELIKITSLFIGWLVLKKLAFGTIRTYLYAVSAFYLDNSLGTFDLGKAFLILRCLQGAKNILGNNPLPKLAFMPEFFHPISARMDTSWVDLRDWAAFLLGFFGLFRKSELLALRWKDIVDIPEELKIWVVVSKTDKDKKSVWIHVTDRPDKLCLKKALMVLLKATPNKSLELENPVFVTQNKKDPTKFLPLTGAAFSKQIKKWVEEIGLNPKDYSGHSLRRGGATALLRAGVPPHLVQIQGQWASDCWKLYTQISSSDLLAITSKLREVM